MAVRLLGLILGGVMSLQACNGADTEPASNPENDASVTEVSTPTKPESSDPVGNVAADTEDTETVRQADSHVHGNATLAIVREDATLTIELDTPMYNLVGFEHAPETDEQTSAVEAAEAALAEPATLFQFNKAAGCAPSSEMVDVHLFDEKDGAEHEHHDHGDEDEHDHDESHGDHKDVVMSYSFTCDKVENLKAVTTTLRTSFPNMTEVEVIYLGPDTQKSVTLKGERNRMRFVD